MCQYSAENGNAGDWHMIHLGQLALSGAGLLIIEATAVEAIGRITLGDLGLYSDDNEAALARVLAAIRRYSRIPVAIQLGACGSQGVEPCAVGRRPVPLAGRGRLADRGAVRSAACAWRAAARCARCRGPGSRQGRLRRGGAARGRARPRRDRTACGARLPAASVPVADRQPAHRRLRRLAREPHALSAGSVRRRARRVSHRACRSACASRPPTGSRAAGTSSRASRSPKALAQRGCSFIHVSSGGVSPLQKIPLSPGYQVPLAERIKAAVRPADHRGRTGHRAAQAEAIVAAGQADLVALARAILFEPHWPWRAAAELGAQVEAPQQYWRSQPRELKALVRRHPHRAALSGSGGA